jgi:GNAT superfamily N-acetyltransferase
MVAQALTYETRELSKKTWPDFVRLFSQGNGWDFCWCMHFHRTRFSPEGARLRTRAELGPVNRRDKKALVEKGRSHGILVYADGRPIGWCQYGPSEELPRIDKSRNYRKPAPEGLTEKLWRITCFVVDKKYRGRGVASAALKAALEAIRNKGGSRVEAYPLTRWRPGTFGNVSTHGTATMFEKEGFKTIAPFSRTIHSTNVLMRKTVRAS